MYSTSWRNKGGNKVAVILALLLLVFITGCFRKQKSELVPSTTNETSETAEPAQNENINEANNQNLPVRSAPVIQPKQNTSTPTTTNTVNTNAPKRNVTVSVSLFSWNDSTQSGTAVLTDIGGKTQVTVQITKPTTALSQPAFMYSGSCANLGASKHALNYVRDGASDTILDITPGMIVDDLPLAIGVSQSWTDLQIIVACGDIIIK